MAAAPLGAKKAASSVGQSLTGYSVLGDIPANTPQCAAEPPNLVDFNLKRLFDIRKYFQKNGLPDWKLDEIRHNAFNEFRGIDPDLDALRSVSIGHKIRRQKQKNFEILKHRAITNLGGHRLQMERNKKLADQFGVEYIDWY
jgi:hypothetical protein